MIASPYKNMLEVITENFHIFAQEPFCFDLELAYDKYNMYS